MPTADASASAGARDGFMVMEMMAAMAPERLLIGMAGPSGKLMAHGIGACLVKA